MVADPVVVVALSVPVLWLGLLIRVDFATGVIGMLVFVAIAALWGLAYTGLPYTIALRTDSPAAVNSSFLIFFPFTFLATTFLAQTA
jgi:ABC-2 type transport system permease protein